MAHALSRTFLYLGLAICFIGSLGVSTRFLKSCKIEPEAFAQSIAQKLHKDQSTILQELASLGISPDMILNEEQKYTKFNVHLTSRYKTLPKVSPPTEKFVREIIRVLPAIGQDFVILHDAKIPCEAACNGNVILINEEKFNKISSSARKFVIAHEIAHTFYRDGVVLDIIFKKLGITDLFKLARENPDHPVCKLSRFEEWRADLWACCAGSEYLEGYKTFSEESVKLLTFEEARTHPSCKERCNLAHAMTQRSNLSDLQQLSFA